MSMKCPASIIEREFALFLNTVILSENEQRQCRLGMTLHLTSGGQNTGQFIIKIKFTEPCNKCRRYSTV